MREAQLPYQQHDLHAYDCGDGVRAGRNTDGNGHHRPRTRQHGVDLHRSRFVPPIPSTYDATGQLCDHAECAT